MISLRFVVLAILVAAAFAGCLTYFVMPLAQLDTERSGGVSRRVPDVRAEAEANDMLLAMQYPHWLIGVTMKIKLLRASKTVNADAAG
jgi:hypothetical protein